MPSSSDPSRAARAVSRLERVHGRRTLVILALICLIGGALRLERVVNPNADPGDDALAYMALAKSLYEEGSYGGEEFRDSSDWSPGAPLLYAGLYYVTGGARDGAARLLQALMGIASLLVIYGIGRRLAGGTAGLLAAGAAAVYPPFIHSTGAVLSEPPALLTFPAAILAFLWAWERRGTWEWLVPGALLGVTALIRPEYLFVGAVLIVVALVALWRRRGRTGALAAAGVMTLAFALAIVPWTVRNLIVLDRVVPISTGSGKALYVGTSLPQDGEYQRVKAALVERYLRRDLEPGSDELDDVDPTPLFDRVAETRPELSRDAALGAIGRDQLFDYFRDDPLGYTGMTVRKVWRMWSGGVGEAMSSTVGRIVQVMIVALALAGLLLLALRRRFDALILAVPLSVITAIGAVTLAPERRNEILMTLVLPLAAAAAVALARRLGSNEARPPAAHAGAQP